MKGGDQFVSEFEPNTINNPWNMNAKANIFKIFSLT